MVEKYPRPVTGTSRRSIQSSNSNSQYGGASYNQMNNHNEQQGHSSALDHEGINGEDIQDDEEDYGGEDDEMEEGNEAYYQGMQYNHGVVSNEEGNVGSEGHEEGGHEDAPGNSEDVRAELVSHNEVNYDDGRNADSDEGNDSAVVELTAFADAKSLGSGRLDEGGSEGSVGQGEDGYGEGGSVGSAKSNADRKEDSALFANGRSIVSTQLDDGRVGEGAYGDDESVHSAEGNAGRKIDLTSSVDGRSLGSNRFDDGRSGGLVGHGEGEGSFHSAEGRSVGSAKSHRSHASVASTSKANAISTVPDVSEQLPDNEYQDTSAALEEAKVLPEENIDLLNNRRPSTITNTTSLAEGATNEKTYTGKYSRKSFSNDVVTNPNETYEKKTPETLTINEASSVRNDKEPRQASLLLVGPKGAGKTTLVYKFLDRDEAPKPTLALDYTYGRKPGRVSMVKDVCHLWEVAGGTQEQLVPTVISSCPLTAVTVIVVVDLSRPEHLFEELLTVLRHLKVQIHDAVKKASMEDKGLQERLAKAALERVGADHPDRQALDPFLVPLVIVGGKYDIFQDYEPESKKTLCRALRFVSHTNGAALQFFSARDAGLIKKAKELLSHYGFGTTEVKSLAQDYNRPLIVPCGSDSLQIIGGAGENAPPMSADGWKHAISAKFPKSDTDTGPRTRLPDDPSKDENYREPDVDNLRAQKDQELERLCREAGRLNQRYADVEL